jgi:hypothetical protein
VCKASFSTPPSVTDASGCNLVELQSLQKSCRLLGRQIDPVKLAVRRGDTAGNSCNVCRRHHLRTRLALSIHNSQRDPHSPCRLVPQFHCGQGKWSKPRCHECRKAADGTHQRLRRRNGLALQHGCYLGQRIGAEPFRRQIDSSVETGWTVALLLVFFAIYEDGRRSKQPCFSCVVWRWNQVHRNFHLQILRLDQLPELIAEVHRALSASERYQLNPSHGSSLRPSASGESYAVAPYNHLFGRRYTAT